MKRYVRSSDTSVEGKSLEERVQNFIDKRVTKFSKFEEGNLYIEKHSLQSLINNYIRYFNQNVAEYGDGFAADWDDDDTMQILYKDGKIRTVNPLFDEGNKKIKVDGIDSIILDGSWGTACAGPHLVAEDYTVYEDIPDVRIEFFSS